MKKTKIKFLFLAMLIGSMTILNTSCEKEKGCTDPDSINYNADAETAHTRKPLGDITGKK